MFPEGRALEFLIVAIVALVVVGPKDLPVLLRRLGQFMAKLRGMAAEFRASFDEMARQSELDELRKEVQALRQGQLADAAAQASGHAETSKVLGDIQDSLAGSGMQLHPPMGYQYAEGLPDASPPVVIAAEPAPKPMRKSPAKTAPAKSTPAKKAAPAKAAKRARTTSVKRGGAKT